MGTSLQQILVTSLLVFLSGWALLTTLTYFGQFIVIFVLAGIVAFLLDYPVTVLQKWLPRGGAGLVVYALVALALVGFGLTIGPVIFEQVQLLAERLPGIIQSSQQQMQGFNQWLDRRGIRLNLDQLQTELLAQITQRAQGVAEGALGFTLSTLTIVVDGILVAVIAFYMLFDGKRVWRTLMRLFPANLRDPLTVALSFNLRVFFAGQLLLGTFMAVVLTPIFWLLGSPFPVLSGLLIGLLELIPFIGATIGIAAVVFLAALQDPLLALYMLIASVIVQQIKDNVITPRVLGNFTGLSPILIFGSLLLGAKVGGLLGVILAIPLTGVVKSILDVLFPEEAAH
ncbi:AI-2E family transporter [Candidatus Cyanaurora vandensis]|uniref:AI-2E family transporter n=1 Tax=Candidatus Cyanaurora vandensis TaxID=2714958 RepID=UPI00257E2F4B|nr:AI-2E family transporter [Candidatus Cyanaurora vandensis]